MRDGGFQRGGGDVVVEEMLLESLAHSSKGLLFWEPVAGSTMGLSESSTPWLRGSVALITDYGASFFKHYSMLTQPPYRTLIVALRQYRGTAVSALLCHLA